MKNLSSIFNKYIENKKYQGIEWIIQKEDKISKDKIGYLDLGNKKKLPDETIYRIWSMTKPIISIAILQMIEENKIKFDDHINSFLPEFNDLTVLKKNYRSIDDRKKVDKMPTVSQLLLHTAGFSYNFLGDIVAKEYHDCELFYSDKTTLKDEINSLARIPLLYEPGTSWVYSVSIDILARIIEIVSGSSLQNELKRRIFDPLGMLNTSFSVSDEKKHSLMTSYHYDNLSKSLVKPDVNPRYISNYGYPLNNKSYARGGIGLYSTANDYMIFANMLKTGYGKNMINILSSQMLKKATENQISLSFLPFEIKNFDIDFLEENVFQDYGWGYGFRVLLKDQGYRNIGEFGWGGAASTFFLVDPKNSITAVLMTQVFQGDPNLQKDFYEFIYSEILHN